MHWIFPYSEVSTPPPAGQNLGSTSDDTSPTWANTNIKKGRLEYQLIQRKVALVYAPHIHFTWALEVTLDPKMKRKHFFFTHYLTHETIEDKLRFDQGLRGIDSRFS